MSLHDFYSNRYLAALLEAESAPKTKKRSKSSDTDDEKDTDAQAEETNTEEDTADAGEGTEEGGDESDTEGSEEESGSDEDSESGSEDETQDENEEDQDAEGEDTEGEGSTDEEGSEGEDDFSLDPDGGESEDNDPPPDGLTDPDDDGSNDSSSEDPNSETNVQTNVLNMSKLDRLLAKRRCLTDFHDLRTSIDTFRNVVEKNEAILDPALRDEAIRDLNKLYTHIGEYLMYRFSYTNYEENLQNYFIFVRSMNDIVKKVDENTQKGKKQS